MNEMSEELATVVAIEGDHAWVVCERRSACSGCQQQSNCGTGTVAKAFPLKAPRLRVRLTAEVRVGQQVRLGIPQESLLRGAALVTMLLTEVFSFVTEQFGALINVAVGLAALAVFSYRIRFLERTAVLSTGSTRPASISSSNLSTA